MSKDKQREAFEAWLAREYPHRTDGYIEWHEDAEEYSLDEVQFAFDAWKAAASATANHIGDVNEMVQAAQQARWLPIESAPRDGTRIIAISSGFQAVVAEWDESIGWWFGETESPDRSWQDCIYEPTHWMPLPPEPKR